jgi:2-keto-3-deoxy-L-arabinonate dehydratase
MGRDGQRRFVGVYPVLPTPFHDDETIDFDGVRAIVEHIIEAGVAGVVCNGLASESYKLSDIERDLLVTTVVETVAGRVDVVVGCEHVSAYIAARRAVSAEDAGATAIMVLPSAFGEALEYYGRIADSVSCPVIIQDAGWMGVQLPDSLLRAIAERAPNARYVKAEVSPTASKIAGLEDAGIECLGGAGGLYLLEELDRGITATLPGCAYPGAYVRLLRDHAAGQCDEAESMYRRLLPLTVHLMQGELFVHFQTRILRRLGVIESTGRRHPAAPVDERQLEWADALFADAALDEYIPARVPGGGRTT